MNFSSLMRAVKKITPSFPFMGREVSLRSYLKRKFSISVDASSLGEFTLEDIARSATPASSLDETGSKIADYLGVSYVRELVLPGSLLFSRTEEEISNLLGSNFILQREEHSGEIIFVTPYPATVLAAKVQYKGKAIRFGITTRSEFERVAKNLLSMVRFISGTAVCSQQWRKAFAMCFLDALELGASEIYFGIPDAGSYEFSVSGKKYEGLIDESVRTQGLKALDGNAMCSIASEITLEDTIQFSRTSYKNREVLVCRWGIAADRVTSLPGFQDVPKKKQKSTSHILLIDDDRRFAELLKKGITAKGFSVSVATSVNDALLYHLETSDDIDLVVTDYHMPHLKGSDLIEIIRAKKGQLPVIVLTSDDAKDTHVHMLTLGCDAVVSKGDDPRILFAWIFRLLDKQARKKSSKVNPGDTVLTLA